MAIFECEICSEDYSNVDENRVPRALKCGHSLCQSCAVQLISDSSILCPFCRETSKVRDGNVKNLQKNFGLVQAIAAMKDNQIKTEPSIDLSGRWKCNDHPQNYVEFICLDRECSSENGLMCQTCENFGDHKGHAKGPLNIMILRDELLVKKKSVDDIINAYNIQIQRIDLAHEGTALLLAVETAKIDHHFKKLHQLIDEQKANSLRKLMKSSEDIKSQNWEKMKLYFGLLDFSNLLLTNLKMTDCEICIHAETIGEAIRVKCPTIQDLSPADTTEMTAELPSIHFEVN